MTTIAPLSVEDQFEILARGAVEIVPRDALRAKLKKSQDTGVPLQIKLGLDPTAPDIHLGNAVVLRKIRQFQNLGHEVTVIIGDFTAAIGDPTGRSETRKQLSRDEVAANAKTYTDQYHKILDPAKTRVVFNGDWLGKLDLYDIANLMAKTTVARLLERDEFAQRFAKGIAIHTHELLYPICQGYDSVVLNSDVELGGTEQRFNILMGRQLQQDNGVADPQVGLFMPLLVGLDGVDKMSKSKGNAVGIDEPPLTMFEKLMRISDEMMPQYFELCTDIPLPKVHELCDPTVSSAMDSKKRLASEIISIYHGVDAAAEAKDEWERRHSKREIPTDIPEMPILAELTVDGKARLAALVQHSGITSTGGEAKRLIQQGGISINGEKMVDPGALIDLTTGVVISSGRRKFVRLSIKV
jgi:tyrosyl-tRNA synthetase